MTDTADARRAARQGLARRRHRLLHADSDATRDRLPHPVRARRRLAGRQRRLLLHRRARARHARRAARRARSPTSARASRSSTRRRRAASPLHRVIVSGQLRRARRRRGALRAGAAPGRPCRSGRSTWPGIKQPTRFIIEALDAGCPFPNGYIASAHHDADIDRTSRQPFNAPSITLDEARLSSGEVFINGQHDPTNRPKPIARAYVDVTPAARSRRWTSSRPSTRAPPGSRSRGGRTTTASSSATRSGRSTPAAAPRTSPSGPCSGSSMLGFADGGSSCNVSITPKNVPTKLAADRYLHVRMIVGHPVDGPALPADHDDQRAAEARSRARRRQHRPRARAHPPRHVPVRARRARQASPGRPTTSRRWAASRSSSSRSAATRRRRSSSATRAAGASASSATAPTSTASTPATTRPPGSSRGRRCRCRATSRATIGRCSGTSTRRPTRVYVFMDGKPSACAVLPRGAHAGGRRHGRLPRRRLPLRHRRDGHARRHRPPVRAQLQPLPQRPPHGRLRHRARRAGAGLGRDACSPAGPGGTVGRERGGARARGRSPCCVARVVGCGGGGGRRRPATDDPDPVFTPDERAPRSRRCATTTGRRRADPSNRVADDPARARLRPAAVLRHGVLGPLLEGDNDGSAGHAGPRRARRAR